MSNYVRELRELVGSSRIFVPGVRAVIISAAGEILLQRRTDTSFWGLPGGAVEPDESAMEALRREVAEETSLEVVEAEPMALYSGSEQRFTYPNGDRVQCFALAFIIYRWTGRPEADGVEGSKLRFFPVSRLPENIMPIHQTTIADYRRFEGNFLLSR